MTDPTRAAREFDLVLFGATGFTGRLVAEYLARARPSIRWALAGRSHERLAAVRTDLTAIDPALGALPLIVGDSLDRASVDAMVSRTRVVCTTVGPYARYGRALVAACAEHATHYCDLTGETLFVRESIDAHHAVARTNGARIVHCCGFDSIPFDLGVLMLADHFVSKGKRLARAHGRVVGMKGGASGGTIASALEMMEQMHDPAIRRVLGDPYALDPRDAPRGADRNETLAPARDADTGHWTAPFVMAAINTRVVRRSNALLDYAGRDFRYDEAMDMGRRGLPAAVAMSAALAAGTSLAVFGPTRRLLARFLPKPGEGPSREVRERGYFRIAIRGESTTGERATARVAGTSDPGYGETAKMLGESALCLATDDLATPGGVLTPAAAMGMVLVERLRRAGQTWRVE